MTFEQPENEMPDNLNRGYPQEESGLEEDERKKHGDKSGEESEEEEEEEEEPPTVPDMGNEKYED